MKRFGTFVALALATPFVLWSSVLALAVPAAPPLDRPIVDTSNTLSAQQIDELAAQIQQSRKEKAYQIGILMVPTLAGASLEDYTLDVARTWGIGEKANNNGVLLFVAQQDHLIRIEVGSGLEGELTDAESGRIIRNVIAPNFRADDYYKGIRTGIEAIQAQVEGRASDAQSETMADTSNFGDIVSTVVFFGVILMSWFGSLLARSRSWWAGGILGGGIGWIVAFLTSWSGWGLAAIPVLGILGLLFDYFVSKNFYYKTASGDTPSWWAGGNWIDTGGGFGGGGGSFGGGGFSGGGSSGSW